MHILVADDEDEIDDYFFVADPNGVIIELLDWKAAAG